MASFIKLQIDRAMNQNSMLSVTVIDPEHEVSDKLVEGGDIVVPLFEGVAFSGMIVRVNREQLTHDGAATHHYMWEVEAVSDEVKLSNDLIPEDLSDEILTMTPGEMVEQYLGDDWMGDIFTGGAQFSYSTTIIDKASVVLDITNQTKFDFRTRRDYSRYESTGYSGGGASQTVSVSGTPFTASSLVGKLLMFVDGLGAFKSYGIISGNTTNSITAKLSNKDLPASGDRFIVSGHPVVDFKPVMGEGASVKTFIANSTILDFSDIDDKSKQHTEIICTGRDYNGAPISSSLKAALKNWSDCTYLAYRGEGVLAYSHERNYTNDPSIIYVIGHQFKPGVGEYIKVLSGKYQVNVKVLSISHIEDDFGRAVTEVETDPIGFFAPKGTDVIYTDHNDVGAKIYVEDNSNMVIFAYIGEEELQVLGKGTDSNGDYILVNRRLWSGSSEPYSHPIGTLVRPTRIPESGSPYQKYGSRIRIVQTASPCSRGDLDRLCSTLLPQSSTSLKSGEGIVPLNQFWKIDNKTSPGYVPLEPGDVVTVRQGGIDTDYVLVSYKIDFDKMRVSVKLGDYGENLASKVRAIQQTLNRKLS